MKFQLIVRSSDLRVVLIRAVDKPTGEVLETIEAENWMAAREKISDLAYYHDFGYGFRVDSPPNAADRYADYLQRKKDDALRVLLLVGENVGKGRTAPAK